MTENVRRKSGVEVDVAVVIHVPQVSSLPPCEGDVGLHHTCTGYHPAWDVAFVALQNSGRAGMLDQGNPLKARRRETGPDSLP